MGTLPAVVIRTGDDRRCSSHLVGRAGDDLVLRAPSALTGRTTGLQPGDHVVVSIATTTGAQELLCSVVFAPAGGDWTVRLHGPALRSQRRAYVRIPLASLVTLCREDEHLRVATVDLSEGGFRCVARSEGLELGEEIEVAFDLHGITVPVRAELVRRQPRHDDRWELAFRFVDLRARDADRIRAFVFNRQIQARMKGVL
ncbi:MAG TPA: PilZ domain-containing protein [Acidimicrobiales bacterium]|nr:PilZ domain-containing protein [Acidimicrobiales bacterium]